jgi:hypothetical protein
VNLPILLHSAVWTGGTLGCGLAILDLVGVSMPSLHDEALRRWHRSMSIGFGKYCVNQSSLVPPTNEGCGNAVDVMERAFLKILPNVVDRSGS